MERFYAGGRRQTYYELFKACRLCGSGGGYKMPVLQSQPTQAPAEPELRHKIRDCCSIDVQEDDKMPPLICELCVDKVNDFYEFREMCHATNSRVRSSLGLPPQTLSQELADDCILGVSGPLIYNSKELELSQSANLKSKTKEKKNAKGTAVNVKKVLPPSPPPPEILPREKRNRKSKVKPQALSLLAERLNSGSKRRRGIEPPVVESAPPIKKLRFSDAPPPKKINSPPSRTEKRAVPLPGIIKKPKEPIVKKPIFSHPCTICDMGFNKNLHLKQHSIAQHKPTIFSEKLGCSPCREWFTSTRLAEEHHKWHKTSSTFYRCDRCSAEFKVLQSYNKHFALKQCIPEETVADPKCAVCLKSFVTENIMKQHKCIDPASIGGNCPKCKNYFPRRAQLKRHQMKCKGAVEVNPNNPLLKTLKPIQITMSKCDNLLRRIKREPAENDRNNKDVFYDVSSISLSRPISIKTEPVEDGYIESSPFDVEIKQEIKEEYPDYSIDDDGFGDDYDSDGAHSEGEMTHTPNLVINPFARKNNTQVESLSFISLRTIFSEKTFKRKSRQKKKSPRILKIECQKSITDSAFDSIVNNSNENYTLNKNISNPIQSPLEASLNCASNENNIDNPISDDINYSECIDKIECNAKDNLEVNNVNNSNPMIDSNIGEEFQLNDSINANEQLCHIDKVVSENTNIENTSTTEEISSVNNITMEPETVSDTSVDNHMGISDKIICNENDCNNRMDVDSVSDADIITSDEVSNSLILGNEIMKTFNENADVENMSIDNDLGNELLTDNIENISETNTLYDTLQPDASINMITAVSEISDIENIAMDREIVPNDSKVDSAVTIEDHTKGSISTESEMIYDNFSNSSSTDITKSNIDNISSGQLDNDKISEKFNNSSDNADLDSYINSVLQEELSPLVMKQRNNALQNSGRSDGSVLVTTKNVETLTVPLKDASQEIKIKDNCVSDNVDSEVTDSYIDKLLQEEITEVNPTVPEATVESTNSDSAPQSDCLNLNSLDGVSDNVDSTIKDAERKLEQESVDKSEADILDLVSDSGDDCNIIDLPEKIKAIEEQLFTSDTGDKESQIMDEATVNKLLKEDDQPEVNKNDTEDISSDSLNSIDNSMSLKDSYNAESKKVNQESEKNSSLEDLSKSLDLDTISDNDFDLDE